MSLVDTILENTGLEKCPQFITFIILIKVPRLGELTMSFEVLRSFQFLTLPFTPRINQGETPKVKLLSH
jgi:hypothetical protein